MSTSTVLVNRKQLTEEKRLSEAAEKFQKSDDALGDVPVTAQIANAKLAQFGAELDPAIGKIASGGELSRFLLDRFIIVLCVCKACKKHKPTDQC